MKETEKILKPMSVARAEFINSLMNLINNSELPLFVTESVLKDVYNEVRVVAQKQYEIDYKAYSDRLKTTKTNTQINKDI